MSIDLVRYKKAEQLRREGNSYSYISDKLNVPKSTISGWFSGKLWSNKIKSDLNSSRLKLAKENLVVANLSRKKKQLQKRKDYLNEARREFDKLINNPLFLFGLGVYWGEGDKVDNGRVAVINTDPFLLRVMVSFYRQCLSISNDKLRIGLFVYEDLNEEKTVNFWSNTLNIPRNQFIKIQKLKSRSKLTKRKSKYGICSLYFSSTKFSVKIHEWIRLLSIHTLSKNAGIV